MGQRAPSATQIGVAVAFAFSCFGLLLFLWTAFGGPVPFAPEGYRVKVPFKEATQLAVESDVRISNVSVGKVKKIELEDEGENRDLAVAEIEIDNRYAPIPEDTLAMLRQKTLLGETYVELTQGTKDGPMLAEDGSLPPAQVAESVQLDEIFRTFDARTRAAFQAWMQEGATSFAGRGADISAAIANLEPFAEDANQLLRVLDTQDEAVSKFVKNTGVVFGALSERQGQLRGLIQNSGTVFATTARRNANLEETFRALPTFLDESRLTLNRLDTFARETNPLITQLRPAAKELSGTLRQVARVSPDLKGFFVGFRKIAKRSRTAWPALQALLDSDLPPVLTQLNPFLRQLTPIVTSGARFRSEITALLGNATAAINGTIAKPETTGLVHYLRTTTPLSPEAFSVFPGTTPGVNGRLRTNRANAYTSPGTALSIGNLPSFGIQNSNYCSGPPGVVATLDPATATDPDFIPRASLDTPADLFTAIDNFAYGGVGSSGAGGYPVQPCTIQGPQQSIGETSESTNYLHVFQDNP